jgi:hypothetical protein
MMSFFQGGLSTTTRSSNFPEALVDEITDLNQGVFDF